MEKEQISSFRNKSLIHDGEGSSIYRLDDGRLLKVAKDVIFLSCSQLGIDYEAKIMDTRAQAVEGIVSPLTAVFKENNCVGYTMEEITGDTLNDYDKDFTMRERSDLNAYFKLYTKLEALVARANKKGIIIPDLCTCDNIMITPDGKIKYVDYDGMQIGENDKAMTISTSLGDPMRYVVNPKYLDGYFHFTKELDKTSLTILMFLWIFNVDLLKVGQYNTFTGTTFKVKDIFDILGIEDERFMNKVAANISDDEKGSYLSDDLYRIVSNYDMMASYIPGFGDNCIKRLTKKIEI